MQKMLTVAIVVGSLLFSGVAMAKGGGPGGGHGGGHGGGRHAGTASHAKLTSGVKGSRSHSYHSAIGHSARSGFHSTHVSSRAKNRSLRADPRNDHAVASYYKKNGTFVASYHAKNPNETRNDNYSARGNINPYTGVAGTKPRDGGL